MTGEMDSDAPSLDPITILSRAADLIESEGAWTQHVTARDAAGLPAWPTAAAARCWCLLGALDRVAPTSMLYETAAFFFRQATGANLIADWNDRPQRRQVEVVSALRRAADLARERGR